MTLTLNQLYPGGHVTLVYSDWGGLIPSIMTSSHFLRGHSSLLHQYVNTSFIPAAVCLHDLYSELVWLLLLADASVNFLSVLSPRGPFLITLFSLPGRGS